MTYRKLASGILTVAAVFFTNTVVGASTHEIQNATSSAKVTFLLVTEPGAVGMDPARDLIRSAIGRVKGSVLVEMDRLDRSNATFVTKYGLSAAPVPLILVVANGVVVGGIPAAQATPDALVKMVPSPKKLEIFQDLQEGKAVLIVASRKGTSAQTKASDSCAKACAKMGGKAAIVSVDMDERAEAELLRVLKVDTTSKGPVTVVVNPQGQITGSFTGETNPNELVLAAARQVAACCGSSAAGASTSCAPRK